MSCDARMPKPSLPFTWAGPLFIGVQRAQHEICAPNAIPPATRGIRQLSANLKCNRVIYHQLEAPSGASELRNLEAQESGVGFARNWAASALAPAARSEASVVGEPLSVAWGPLVARPRPLPV